MSFDKGFSFYCCNNYGIKWKKKVTLLLNVLKDNGFVIITKEERGDFTFFEGTKIKLSFVCNSIFYILPIRLESVTYLSK